MPAFSSIDGARRRVAALIYPGQLPSRQPPVKAKPAGPRTAANVSYREATAFFEQRMASYKALARAAAPFVDPEGVFLDVGANIGFFTKVLARETNFRGTAHLFEPLPHLVNHARATASRLPFSAPVHAFGLGDEDTKLRLFIDAAGNFGWNTMVAEKASPGMVPIRIRIRRFDPKMIRNRVPSFVKIDVEGAEYRVLRGMLPALEEWNPRPPILCEIGWGVNHPNWDEELAVFKELAALGYEAVKLNRQPIDLEALDKTTDVLFIPTV